MTLKQEFGRQLRKAREKKKLSRAALGARLGVHWKTVQSWEDGRTFIENLELIPAIEREIQADLAGFFARLTAQKAPRVDAPIGAAPAVFVTSKEVDEDAWVAVPIVKLRRTRVENPNDMPLKTDGYTLVPAAWTEGARTKNLMALPMRDKQMEPVIPHRGLAIVNASAYGDIRFDDGDLVAGFVNGRGLRVRYVHVESEGRSHATDKLTLVPREGGRGIFPVRPSRDRILGRVIGVQARISGRGPSRP